MRIAILSDLHVCERWMPPEKIASVVAQANAERPDLIVLPGDFLVGHLLGKRPVHAEAIAEILAGLTAPLGVYASLGNHDWSDCPEAKLSGYMKSSIVAAFEKSGIPVLCNRHVALQDDVYLAGLDSAIANGTTWRPQSRHDAKSALCGIPKNASILMMAHEPDVFLDEDHPVALQLSGHTHGGQIGALGILATYPSRHGLRLDYGLKRQGPRHLVVTSGLGYGALPVRIGRVSEIAIVQIASAQ